MKILIITQKVDEEDDVLGFFTYWIKSLAEKVEGVEVICLAKGKFDLPPNVRIYSIGKDRRWPKFMQAAAFYFYALRLLPNIDGVFVHMAPEYVRAIYPLNVLFKRPIVMWYAHIKVSSTARWAIAHVDHILTPSKESFGMDSTKVVSTGHGINTEMFSPREKVLMGDVLVLSRISRVKKIETIIEAARFLPKEIRIKIYGKPAREEDEAYLAELRSLVSKYSLEEQISWQGAVSNKNSPEVYAAHKIFVRLQGGGGFGKTELEAMSMGIPAIVPTEVYLNELGEFGRELYFPENDYKTLAERIESVLSWDADKRGRYANLSRQLVIEKHNVKNVAQAVIDFLEKASNKATI